MFDTTIGSDSFDSLAFGEDVATLAGVNSTWVNVQSTPLAKRANTYNVLFSVVPPHKNLLKFGNKQRHCNFSFIISRKGKSVYFDCV